MQDDKTIIMPPSHLAKQKNKLQITVQTQDGKTQTEDFSQSHIVIGRDQHCDLVIDEAGISRQHMEISWDGKQWCLRDLGSTNGVWLDEQRIDVLNIDQMLSIHLGHAGIHLQFRIDHESDRESRIKTNQALPAKKRPLNPQNAHTKIETEAATPLLNKIQRQQGTQIKTQAKKSTPDNTSSDLSTSKQQAQQKTQSPITSKKAVYQHYLDAKEEDIGDHTRIVREIIKDEKKRQSRKYHYLLSFALTLLVLMVAVIFYQQHMIQSAKKAAIDIFYDMKAIEINIAQAEANTRVREDLLRIEEERERLAKMRQRYAQYVAELDARKQYTHYLEKLGIMRREKEAAEAERQRLAEQQRLSEQQAGQYNYVAQDFSAKTDEELILQVARDLGECELELPEGFVSEVKAYIRKWQSSKRLPRALARMQKNSYQPVILQAFQKQHLPLHFLYLGLQESNFKYDAIGPETRFGIAKGAWQFIPGTAGEYGLKTGPLAGVREFDADDERFDFDKATHAAARYLKDIYSGEAQASGLLVMASYNWGHNRVKKLIRQMPENPRERNFWRLISDYKIPKETYDYVFYIFSAAVIGLAPEKYGFSFKPPLSL